MKRILKLYKYEFLYLTIGSILFLWAMIASTALLLKKDKISYILKTNEGIYTLDEIGQEDQNIHTKNFLKLYVDYIYNYNKDDFQSKMDRASFLMTEDLWKRINQSMSETKKIVTEKNIRQSSTIQKITKKADTLFEVIINSITQTDSVLSEKFYKLTIKTKFSKKNQNNLWEMEVDDVTEEPI